MERDRRPPVDHVAILTAYRQAAEQARYDPTADARRRVAQTEGAVIAALLDPTLGRFDLGHIVATPGALAALDRAGQNPPEFLLRHKFGDWGELDPEDRRVNEHALRHDQRLLSAYRSRRDERLWVITAWDRSATTLLLPEDY